MNRPDFTRLKSCMRRAEAGEELTIGFFGGSITQDSLATKHENCYAYRVFRWWEETFPKAVFRYVNGGGWWNNLSLWSFPCGNRYVDVSAGFCGSGLFCK